MIRFEVTISPTSAKGFVHSGSVRVGSSSVSGVDSWNSKVTLPNGDYIPRFKFDRDEMRIQYYVNNAVLDLDRIDSIMESYFCNTEEWMTSYDLVPNKDPVAVPEERAHLKKDDLVKFEHHGEIVTALVKNVSNKNAQVKIYNIGDVVWKS